MIQVSVAIQSFSLTSPSPPRPPPTREAPTFPEPAVVDHFLQLRTVRRQRLPDAGALPQVRAESRVMTRPDPLAAGLDAKRTALLLRDARAVLRTVDVLTATAAAVQDPVLAEIAALRDAAERVVTQLGRRGGGLQGRS